MPELRLLLFPQRVIKVSMIFSHIFSVPLISVTSPALYCGGGGYLIPCLGHLLIRRTDLVASLRKAYGDFPGGTELKNPPANAGDMGSSPGLGRSHMPRSN